MLQRLHIQNFTVFSDVELEFASGINIIIGSNGTGKSHLLKLAYTMARWSQESCKSSQNDKASQQKRLADKLLKVFRPDSLGRLARRGTGGRQRAEVALHFAGHKKRDFTFSFATNSKNDVTLDKQPTEYYSEETVFFPTKEMLSMFPKFASLYRDYDLAIDETYYDLCLALERPLLRGPRFQAISKLLDPIEKILNGKISVDNGRFYLNQKGQGEFEISLVAEGFRKLGAVAYLLANGALAKQSVLFWDEPETNLNPAYMQDVAKMLARLAANGTQVFVATHSLFMLREISLQLGASDFGKVPRRFFALSQGEDGTIISAGANAEAIEPIKALDAEIEQSERYLKETAIS
ncbi:MAG: ATP-binding protein [Burkholderiales bacterium]|nr:ATP-binding protein [Opitutaceae bacterium]